MKTKHLQTILVLSRAAATAVRRLAFRLCTLIWKAVLLFFITMAVALTALAFNAAFFVYRKLADRWAATVRRFFETYFYAELRERCSALEGRFDLVHGQIGRLKEELEGAARTQAAVEKRTAQRLELLKQAMAEGNALLEKIASKEEEAAALNGFVGNIHHHHHHHHHHKDQDQDQQQQQFSPVSFDSGTSAAAEERHHLQLLTPPPPPPNLEMFSSFPVDSILSHLNSNVGDGIGTRSRSRGSCAFYGGSEEEEESCCSLSPPVRPPSNLCRPSSSPPPPPPPPPPSMFAPATFGKVSFKSTSQQQKSAAAVQTSKFVVSESEIAAMRNKLKKVPAKPGKTEKEDS